MNKGNWVWPSDPRRQKRVLKKVSDSPHLMAAMNAIAKSKEAMSNAELDDAINDSSEWMTLWVIRQLMSLGFIDFKVDFFGNPARYDLTELGRSALGTITGKPVPPRPPIVSAPPPTPARPATPPAPPMPPAAAPKAS